MCIVVIGTVVLSTSQQLENSMCVTVQLLFYVFSPFAAAATSTVVTPLENCAVNAVRAYALLDGYIADGPVSACSSDGEEGGTRIGSATHLSHLSLLGT